MSGQQEFKSGGVAKTRMNKVMEALDEYESSLTLPKHTPPGTEEELENYFTMDRRVMESLSAKDAAGIAVRLNQYGIYIQRELNREEARTKWADSEIARVACKEINTNYSTYLKHEIKLELIAKENTYIAELVKLKNYSEQRIRRLSYLGKTIDSLSEAFLDLRRAKFNE